MRIGIIGASGMVGSRIAAEALRRGHQVVAGTRGGTPVEGAEALAIDLADTAAVTALADDVDALVVSVSGGRDGTLGTGVIDAHRALLAARPGTRLFVVGGAGALEAAPGVLVKDTEGFPPEYFAEASTFTEVLDLYRAAEGVDWTMLAPSPVIAPGERTGEYVLGTDSPAGESVSAEDFAVAALDELETPAHRNSRFTVAN